MLAVAVGTTCIPVSVVATAPSFLPSAFVVTCPVPVLADVVFPAVELAWNQGKALSLLRCQACRADVRIFLKDISK